MEMRLVPSQYLLIMISSVTGFCVLNMAFLKRPRVATGFLIIYNGGEPYIIPSTNPEAWVLTEYSGQDDHNIVQGGYILNSS